LRIGLLSLKADERYSKNSQNGKREAQQFEHRGTESPENQE
jgi:hypothetical protein